MIIGTDADTNLEAGEADGVLTILCAAYPGHPWFVMCRGGVIFIRYLEPNIRGGYGMNVRFKHVNHDAAVMKREIIRMAGEWLERAGLVRGRNNDDEIVSVEGIPLKYQPPSQKSPVTLDG